jgi:hypothetical protein
MSGEEDVLFRRRSIRLAYTVIAPRWVFVLALGPRVQHDPQQALDQSVIDCGVNELAQRLRLDTAEH